MIDQALREAEQKMAKAVEVAKDDFAAIRTGRAHPQMFASLLADYYGTPTPLQQLAGFQVPEPRTVLISPYDYIKVAKSKAEEARVSVRNIRRHAMDQVHKTVKDGDAGEDEGKSAEKRLDGLTKKYVDSIDELLKHKEAELLEV